MRIPVDIACIVFLAVILATIFFVWLARVVKFAKTGFYTSNEKTYDNNYYDHFNK